MEIKRDNLGFLKIDINYVDDFTRTDKYGVYSFKINNSKYYLKEFKNTPNIHCELIGYEIGKEFGLNVVPYDIAFVNEYVGYLSKEYMKDGYVYLEDLLRSFYGTFVDKNNLNDIGFMFLSLYNEKTCRFIINDLINLMMFDIVIANSDRHDRNIIIDMNNLKLGPVSDNEMLLSDLSIVNHYYSLSVNNKDCDKLEEFLDILDDEQLNYFRNKLELIKNNNLLKIFDKVEKRLGKPMIESIKKNIMDKYSINYKDLSKHINNKLKKKGRSKKLWK